MNTNGIGNSYAAQAAAQAAAAPQAKDSGKVNNTNGQKEIGNPKLSEKAQKYYDQLKKKFSNMDFILVSADKKEEAQANMSKYGNSNRLVVLIDDEKIERMAEDLAYREKYEKVLRGATTQFTQMKSCIRIAYSVSVHIHFLLEINCISIYFLYRHNEENGNIK